MSFPVFRYPSECEPPLSLLIEQQPDGPGHWRPDAFFRLDNRLRTSGFLGALAPDDVKTFFVLLSFLTPDGRIAPALPQLAEALRQSGAKARARIERLCATRWQGQAFVVSMPFESGLEAWTLAPGFLSIQHREPQVEAVAPIRSGSREAVVAHSRQAYGRSRAEVEAEINAQFRSAGLPVSAASSTSSAISSSTPVPSLISPSPRLAEEQIASFLHPQDNNPQQGNNPQEEYEAVHAELLAAGLDAEQAGTLQARYSSVRIRRQLAWLPYREAKNPAGLLIAAIKDDYAAPRHLRSAEGHVPTQERITDSDSRITERDEE